MDFVELKKKKRGKGKRSFVLHDRRERARDLLVRLESLVRRVSLVRLSELALPINQLVSMDGISSSQGPPEEGETYSNWCNSRNNSTSLGSCRNSSRHVPCVASDPDITQAHRGRCRQPPDHPISSSRRRQNGFHAWVETRTKYGRVCRHAGNDGHLVFFVCRIQSMQPSHR